MQLFFRLAAVVLLSVTVVFLSVVIKEWNVQYDAHGRYVSPDGIVHRESQSEKALFLLLFSAVLLFVTGYFSVRKRA